MSNGNSEFDRPFNATGKEFAFKPLDTRSALYFAIVYGHIDDDMIRIGGYPRQCLSRINWNDPGRRFAFNADSA
jgi:hypothetical protein